MLISSDKNESASNGLSHDYTPDSHEKAQQNGFHIPVQNGSIPTCTQVSVHALSGNKVILQYTNNYF